MKIKIYYLANYCLHVFWCPACQETHTFDMNQWHVEGNLQENPSYYPSLLYPNCHLILRDGIIHYLDDCKHDLAGHSVNLVEW